jgi:hypothetical protein
MYFNRKSVEKKDFVNYINKGCLNKIKEKEQ